jgi:citronellol/citronellal dehydrogenase
VVDVSAYQSVFRPGLFEGQVHLVTGAGSGIGRCIAHELASLGATVVMSGRKEEKLRAVRDEIVADGGAADTEAFDIRDEDAVTAAIGRILERHPRIHGLVNNAGGQFPAPLQSINQKGFETVVRTNLTGGFLVAREVFAQTMKDHGGAVVNIVADMWNGMPGMGHSGAARAGMVNLTKTAAFEWAAHHVRVNAVAPGWIASSGLDSYGAAMAPIIARLKDDVPLGRLGTEAETSAAVVFLLSPAAAFVNGACLQVDGGAPLGNAVFPRAETTPAPSFDGFHRAVRPKALGEDE